MVTAGAEPSRRRPEGDFRYTSRMPPLHVEASRTRPACPRPRRTLARWSSSARPATSPPEDLPRALQPGRGRRSPLPVPGRRDEHLGRRGRGLPGAGPAVVERFSGSPWIRRLEPVRRRNRHGRRRLLAARGVRRAARRGRVGGEGAGDASNRLFYLAMPPASFREVLVGLHDSGLLTPRTARRGRGS